MSWHQEAARLLEEPIMVGRNGPALWETLLEATDESETLIAGGCIRDYLLGLEPKDIDIFVPLATREELTALAERLNRSSVWSVSLIEMGNEEEYQEAYDGLLIGVLEGEALGLPVNIIARTAPCPWDLIQSFDYGILQWSFQATDRAVVGTTQAIMDLAGRTATLTRNNYYDQSIERFKRFSTRNPGALRLVDPYGAAL
jgi:hypothetical protein